MATATTGPVPSGYFRCNRKDCTLLHPLTGQSLLDMGARSEYIYAFAEAQNRPSKCGTSCKRNPGCPYCVTFCGYTCGDWRSPYLTFAKEDLQGIDQRSILGTTRLASRLMLVARELYALETPTERPYASQEWYKQTMYALEAKN
jgi:hypothetical protein